jgi:hypothetical protein
MGLLLTYFEKTTMMAHILAGPSFSLDYPVSVPILDDFLPRLNVRHLLKAITLFTSQLVGFSHRPSNSLATSLRRS